MANEVKFVLSADGGNFVQVVGGATQNLGNMGNVAKEVADKISSTIAAVNGSMQSITKIVDLAKNALIGLSGVAGVAAFASMVKGNIEAVASLGKLATQAGTTVEALSGLASVGKLSGTSADGIAAAMNKMTKAVSGTTEDAKGAGAALSALGISFSDFDRMSADQRMVSVAKAMDKFSDGTGKSAAAMALMGKSGAEMLPYMKDLATVGELHAKVTGEQAAQAKDFEQNLKRVTATSEAWKKEVSMGMLPALDEASKAWLGVINGAGGLREEISKLSKDGTITDWTRTAITGLTYVMDVFSGLKAVVTSVGQVIGAYVASMALQFGSLFDAFGKAIKGDFSGALDTMKGAWSQQKSIIGSLGDDLDKTWGEKTLGSKMRERIKDIQNIKAAAEAAKPALADGFNRKAAKPDTDAELKSIQALNNAEIDHIAILKQQALQLDALTHSQQLLEKLKTTSIEGYSKEALAARASYEAHLQEGIALEKAAAARKADIDAIVKYQSATESNIIKLQEEAATTNLTSLALQKITATRQIDKAASDAIYKTKTDEFNVTTKILNASPEVVSRILAEAEADKTKTNALIEQVAAQKLILQYDQEIAKLKEESVVYFDPAAKAAAGLELEAAKRRKVIEGLTEESDKRKQLEADYAQWYQLSMDKIGADKLNALWQSVDQTAHATFTNIFQGGQDAFTKLRDTLKSTLLDLLYQMTVKKWIFDISASVSGSGVAASAIPGMGGGGASGGSLISTASNLNSLYNTGGSFLTTAGNVANGSLTLGQGAASLYANAIGVPLSSVIGSAAASTVGATVGGTAIGGSLGIGSGTVLGGGAATGAAGGTGMMAGIGNTLSAIPVWGWIAAALLTQLGGPKIDQVGNGLSGTLAASGGSNLQTRTDYTEDHHGLFGIGAFTTHNSSYSDASQGTTDYINTAVSTVTDATKSYAKAIGLSADAVEGYTQAIDVTLTGLNPAQAQAEITKSLTAFTDGMVTSAYGGAIAALARTGESSSTTLARLAGDITAVNGTFKALGQSLLPISIDGTKAAAGLVDAFGGLDKMQSSVSTYYNLMYSDSEKSANAVQALDAAFASLHETVPKSNAEFRALVDGLDRTVPSQQALYASLINLAPAFDQVTKAAQQTAAAAEQAAQAATTSAVHNWGSSGDVRNNDATNLQTTLHNSGLDIDLQTILRSTKESVLALYNSTDAGTQAILKKNQQAIYDFVNKGGAESQGVGIGVGSGLYIPSSNTSTNAAPVVDPAIAERLSLQQQLDALTLSGIELQKKQIAAQRELIQESNKELFDQVQSAQLAKTNAGWQEKIDIASGARTQREVALQHDLASASDSSTQGLIKMAYAAEDVATAAAAAAKAAEAAATKFNSAMASLASQGTNLQIQLLQANGDATGAAALKRTTDLAAATQGFTQDQITAYANLYDANTLLAKQVQDAQAAQQAAAQAAQQATQAAAQLKSAWQSVTDSIFSEVARIRGVRGTPQESLAQAQESFAISTAQVRAGDQGAAKLLPALSQTLLTLAESQATSLQELRRIQGQTAASLELTGTGAANSYGLKLPSFAVGTDYVPADMIAMVHRGEQIVPAAYNPNRSANGGTGNAELVAEIGSMRQQLAAMQLQLGEANGHARRTANATNGAPESVPRVKVLP